VSSQKVSKIFVIEATGGHGLPVVRGLVDDGQYSVLALSRDANPVRAKSLFDIGNEAIVEDSFAAELAV
jgi:uncharacterized protein YbjT (DUF2867 family)